MLARLVTTALLVIFLCSGCSRGTVRTPSELSVRTSHVSSRASGKIGLIVVTEYFRTSGESPIFKAMVGMDPSRRAEELLALELRRAFVRDGKVAVFAEPYNRGGRYRLVIACTGIATGVSASSDSQQVLSPETGPAWAVLQGLEALSNIGVGGDEKSVISTISFDIQLVDGSGAVVFSEPYAASFQARYARVGGVASSSSKTTYAASVGMDAVRVIAEIVTSDVYRHIGAW